MFDFPNIYNIFTHHATMGVRILAFYVYGMVSPGYIFGNFCTILDGLLLLAGSMIKGLFDIFIAIE